MAGRPTAHSSGGSGGSSAFNSPGIVRAGPVRNLFVELGTPPTVRMLSVQSGPVMGRLQPDHSVLGLVPSFRTKTGTLVGWSGSQNQTGRYFQIASQKGTN